MAPSSEYRKDHEQKGIRARDVRTRHPVTVRSCSDAFPAKCCHITHIGRIMHETDIAKLLKPQLEP